MRGDQSCLACGGTGRHAGSQSRIDDEEPLALLASIFRGQRQGSPQLCVQPFGEDLRHDPDDGDRARVQPYASPEHARIGAESLRPDLVTQHGHVVPSRRRLIVRKDPSKKRTDTEHGEIVAAHACAANLLGQLVRVDERERGEFGRPDGGKRSHLVVPGQEQGRAAPLVDVIQLRMCAHDPLGFGKRQRSQDHRIHDAEYRCCGADTDAQRHDQQRSEAGSTAQMPQRERRGVSQFSEAVHHAQELR